MIIHLLVFIIHIFCRIDSFCLFTSLVLKYLLAASGDECLIYDVLNSHLL